MIGDLELRIKTLITIRQKIQAYLIFCEIDSKVSVCSYMVRLQHLLKGIDGLLLLVSEEERFILETHLIKGMKWESTIMEYQQRWAYDVGTDQRSYLYRQSVAIRKISRYIEKYSSKIDFSWLKDPLIDELSEACSPKS